MFRVISIRKEYLTSLCMFWSISRPLLLSFLSPCSMQIHAYMRMHLLFRLHQTAKGCCENNGICLKKHSVLCTMSLDMETTTICGLKRRTVMPHFISSFRYESIFLCAFKNLFALWIYKLNQKQQYSIKSLTASYWL